MTRRKDPIGSDTRMGRPAAFPCVREGQQTLMLASSDTGVSATLGEDELRLSRASLALCVFVAVLMALPVSVIGGQNNHKNVQKDWTLLMYWDTDNSLELCTEFALSTWEESLPSNADVNIVALVDLLSEDGTWIWEIVDGQRKLVDKWDELNTSDPDVLKMFVEYGMAKFPAQKTLLVLQNHGYSWRGIIEDETNGDLLMPIDGVGAALESVKADMGKGVDVLAFDACNMMLLEVVYELKDAVPYIVGSQTTVSYDGLPYEMFIPDLVANPGMSPAELAIDIAYDYAEYYSSKWDYSHMFPCNQDFAPACAVDTSKLDALGDAFGQFCTVLEPIIPDHMKVIEDARGYALIGQWANMAGWEWTPDVGTFVEGLREIPGHPELTAAIDEFKMAYDDAIIAEAHSKRYKDTVTGLSLWFPPSLSQYNSIGYYYCQQFVYHDIGLDLVAETSWVDCLMTYYGS